MFYLNGYFIMLHFNYVTIDTWYKHVLILKTYFYYFHFKKTKTSSYHETNIQFYFGVKVE